MEMMIREQFENIWVWVYTFIVLFIASVTVSYLDSTLLLPYIACFLIYYLNIIISLDSVNKNNLGKFNHIFSILLMLGFPVKYSAHVIWKYGYLEPVGYFNFSNESFAAVLWVATMGGAGIMASQLLMRKFFLKKNSELNNEIQLKQRLISFLAIICLASTLTMLNLKFNILLFGLTPSLKIPFGGNAIFFLMITRGILFLIFYYVLHRTSLKWTSLSSLIVLVISIGVLSRMLMVMFFFTILLNFLTKKIKHTYKDLLLILLVMFGMSFISVKLTTNLREFLYEKNSGIEHEHNERSIASEYLDKFERYIDAYRNMVIDRWIGMEGVMAVEGYPGRSFSLFYESMFEKSYKGNSFYTKIADEKNYLETNSVSQRKIATSVPGPIAYFYYSGSKIFVFLMMFFSSLLISAIEGYFSKKVQIDNVSNFIAIFMVFDFFQFGIAPVSLLKNWAFTFIVIYIFLNRKVIVGKLKFKKVI